MWLTNRPAPLRDGIADEYWRKSAIGKLVIQKCADCSSYIFPPRVMCPTCWSSGTLDWAEVSGDGVVHAFSIVNRPPFPEFNEGQPYVVALVELAEGVVMMSNVVGCEPSEVTIGMPVGIAFDELADGALPVFVPSPSTGRRE